MTWDRYGREVRIFDIVMVRNDLSSDVPELLRLRGQRLVITGTSELAVGAVYVKTLDNFKAGERDLLTGRRRFGRHLPTRDTLLVNSCDLEVCGPQTSLQRSCLLRISGSL